MELNVKASVDRRSVDDVVQGLKYVSSIPFVTKAFDMPRIKRRLLQFLQSIYPESPLHNRHIVTGFRTYDVPGMQDKVGFVLKHRDSSNPRTLTILRSLEEGSRGYYRFPNPNTTFTSKDGKTYGIFAISPGDGRGRNRGSGDPEGVDFAMKTRLHIPTREGGHYMSRTFEFAREVCMSAKPEYFRQVAAAFKGRKRS